MSTKVKLSMEDQIIFWFSTAQSDQADALLARVKGVVATRRKQSRTFVKKVKANSAKAAIKSSHDDAISQAN